MKGRRPTATATLSRTVVLAFATVIGGVVSAVLVVAFLLVLNQPTSRISQPAIVASELAVDPAAAQRLERFAVVQKHMAAADMLTTELLNRALSSTTGRPKLAWSSVEIKRLEAVAEQRQLRLVEQLKQGSDGVARVRQVGRKNIRQLVPATLQGSLDAYLEREVTYRGRVRVYTATVDDPNQPDHGHVTEYWLDGAFPGGSVQLFFEQLPTNLWSGDSLLVGGLLVGDALASGSGDLLEVTGTVSRAALGEQRLLVMLVNFQDKPLRPFTAASVEATLQNKIAPHVAANSMAQASLTWRVLDWMTLPMTVGSTCPTSDIMTKAIAAANATYADLDFRTYTRLMVVFPSLPCGYAGLGTLGLVSRTTPDGVVNVSEAWVVTSASELSANTATHELGHNLGVNHSQTLDCGTITLDRFPLCQRFEYGNLYDVMGNGNGDFTAWKKMLLGWVPTANVTVVGPDSAGGTYTIRALEQAVAGTQVVKVFRGYDGWGQPWWYFLEKRSPTTGNDAYLSQVPPRSADGNIYPYKLGGVLISVGYDPQGTDTGWAKWLLDLTPTASTGADHRDAPLPLGATFTDRYGRQITTVADADSQVTVTVQRPLQDTLGPELALAAPKPGSEVRGVVTLKAYILDDRSVVPEVEFFKDGISLGIGRASVSGPASLVWDTTGEANGSTHVIRLQARDASGNLGVSPDATYVVNNSPPTAAFVTPTAGATVQGVVPITIDARAPVSAGRLQFVRLLADGIEVANIPNLMVKPYGNLFDGTWDTYLLANGSHVLVAEAVASDGSSGRSAPITVTVANPLPVARITAPADGMTLTGPTTVVVELIDPLRVGAVRQVVLFADRVQTATDGVFPYEFAWDPGAYNITRTLNARVDFTDGSAGFATSISVKVSRFIASSRFTAPLDGATVTGTVPVKVEILERYQPMAASLLSVTLHVDGQPALTVMPPGDDLMHYTLPWDSTTVTSDAHELFAVLDFDYGLVGQAGPITVHVANQQNLPPVADAGADQTAVGGTVVTLDGSRSADPEGDPVTYVWVPRSGSPTVELTNPQGATPTFTAPVVSAATTLTFQLTVTSLGGSATDEVTVAIQPPVNRPPVANAGVDQSVASGSLVTLDASASADPDGTALTYAWVRTSGPVITLSSSTAPRATFSAPTVSVATAITFQLTVKDPAGATASDSVTVTVQPAGNRAPVLAFIANQSGAEGQLLTFAISATDPDGDAVTYSAANLPLGASFEPVATQRLIWTPSYAQANVYLVTFSVSDGRGASDSQTVTLTIANTNRPPAFSATTVPTGAEGSPLSFTVSATDPDGDAVTYSATGVPTGASFSPSTRQFGWTPSFTQAGSYLVTFTARDPAGLSATQAVTLTVANTNRAPTAQAGADQNVTSGAAITLDAIASSDPDGEPLTYRWQQTAGPSLGLAAGTAARFTFTTPSVTTATAYTFTLTVTDPNGASALDAVAVTVTPPTLTAVLTANPSSGSAPLNGVSLTVNVAGSASGLWSATFDCTNDGVAERTLTAQSGNTATVGSLCQYPTLGTYIAAVSVVRQGVTARATTAVVVSITPNRAPVLTPIPAQAGSEGVAMAFSVSASDPDGDALTYTMTGAPAGATLNPTLRRFDWTPSYAQAGSYTVRFAATDPGGLNDSALVTINIVNTNRAPVAAVRADQTDVVAGGAVTLDGSGSSDSDEDVLAYQWTTVTGPGATVESPQQKITRVTFAVPDTYVLRLTVADATLADRADVTVTVRPAPCAPVWDCTNWSICDNGWQTRSCTDARACGDEASRPPLQQSCQPQDVTATDATNIYFTPHIQGRKALAGMTFILVFADPISGTAVYRHELTVDPDSGKLRIAALARRPYHLFVTVGGYLRQRLTLTPETEATVELPELLAGDLNNDGLVNTLDWSAVNLSWFTDDAAADFNSDGVVNSLDFSWLNLNWNRQGE